MNSESGELEKPDMAASLLEIEKKAGAMQSALLSRNYDAIMAAVADQEALAARIAGLCETPAALPARGDSSLKPLVERVRKLLRRNAAIAAAFLDVMDKTMRKIGYAGANGQGGYDRAGKTGAAFPPLLVQCQG